MTNFKSTFAIHLSAADLAALRWLAAQWGMTIGRGSMAAEGSIRKLLISLARGEALYVLRDDGLELDVAINRAYELQDRLIDDNP